MRLLILISVIWLTACGGQVSTDPNTAYPFQITEAANDKSKLKRVVIATVNYSKKSPEYIRQREDRVDAVVAEYLTENGYEVVTGNQFDSLWSRYLDTYGAYFNPNTATFRRDRFNSILADTLSALKQQYDVDMLVFTDILVSKVNFDSRDPHYAYWHGIKRKPRLRGGQGVPSSFSWAKSFRAASLSVTIFRTDKEFLFNSVGGIEMVDNLNVKSGTPKATRNKDLFDDEDRVGEAVAIAFHPLIEMEDYPGNQAPLN